MARIAVGTVPHVILNSCVMRVRLGLCMADRALKHGVVRWIRMTRGTHSPGIAVTRREPRVIERCAGPRGGRMAGLARRGVTGRSVARIRRPGVVGRVTRIAAGVGKPVIAVDVTRLARCRHVSTRQGEFGRIVIERRRLPCRGVVAHLTRRRKSGCQMIGGCGGRELALMARVTRRRCRREASTLMARHTRHRFVSSGQRERGDVMVEACVPGKCRDRMAVRALRRKSGRCVVRVCRAVVVYPVAADAGDRCPEVLVVGGTDVTILTVERCVPADERESARLMFLNHIRNFPGLVRVTSRAR